MTGRILIFESADRFILGTVGLPGERTFFIQVREGNRLASVSLEKSQAQALSDRLTAILRELRQNNPLLLIDRGLRDDLPLEGPIEEEFRVDLIGIAYDSAKELIQIELQAEEDVVRVSITPSQAFQFSERSKAVIEAGRLPCPFCGGPIDSHGHLCPRSNGYRR
jgi:uncharacterized repeat protein (TIGR03847 family)